MSIFLDIFYSDDDDDDDIFMWTFGGISLGVIFKSEKISEKQCGFVDDHQK